MFLSQSVLTEPMKRRLTNDVKGDSLAAPEKDQGRL